LKADALFIPIWQVARPSVGSCIVLIICVMLSDVNLHYLTLAAHCPVSLLVIITQATRNAHFTIPQSIEG